MNYYCVVCDKQMRGEDWNGKHDPNYCEACWNELRQADMNEAIGKQLDRRGISSLFLPVAYEAIELVNSGQLDAVIELPNGKSGQAAMIFTDFGLGPFQDLQWWQSLPDFAGTVNI